MTGALGLAARIRHGEISADEALDLTIARIEGQDKILNAVVHRFEDQGRAAIKAGLPEGPFTGVPFLLKNTNLEVAGTILSTGSKLFDGMVSQADSTLTARYRRAGLVLIGKTNTPELALSFTTEPDHFGATRNPHDITRTAGGSSGGSAAAVAAGYVTMAHSSDGAGSTRVPAAHCGLFGYKPSRMLNPLGPAAVDSIGGMSTPHALTATVADSAALLDATAGADLGDPFAQPAHGPFLAAVTTPPGRQRIGLTLASPLGGLINPANHVATQKAAKALESLGHHVEETTAHYDAEALQKAWRVIIGTSIRMGTAGRARALTLTSLEGWVEPVTLEWIEEARGYSATDYLAAVNTLHGIARALGRFFAQYDLLLSPTTSEPAPKLGVLAGRGKSLNQFLDAFWAHAPYSCAFNAAGCPAMSLPFGRTTQRLPLGIHLGAGFGKDALLFSIAGQLEAAYPWKLPPA